MSNIKELFNKRLLVEIPVQYKEIEDKEDIFLGANKPNYIFENKSLNSYITVTKSSLDITDSLEEILQALYNQYRRVIPNFKSSDLYLKKIETVEVGAFQYTSTTSTRDLYNLVGLFAIDGKQTLMTMHCDIENAIDEGSQFMKILESIRVSQSSN